MQWMRYSHKEYCELCGHRFSFQPIYAPDMPRVLPLKDVLVGLMSAVLEGARCWLHYSLVGMAWFGVVPLSAYRTYRYLFRASSFDMILTLPFDIFSMENLAADAFRGCFVVTCTLLSFIGLVWLREQILHGGGPDWLERDDAPLQAAPVPAAAPPPPPTWLSLRMTTTTAKLPRTCPWTTRPLLRRTMIWDKMRPLRRLQPPRLWMLTLTSRIGIPWNGIGQPRS